MKSPVHSTAQLARQLGLSRWTVSRALNGHAGVDPRTAARIRETARREGFTPSLLGSGLRSGRTNLAGICLPDLVDYFLTTKITFLQEALRRRGLDPLIQISGGAAGENTALARFAAMRCAGVVLIASPLGQHDPGPRKLAEQGVPLVWIDPAGRDAGPSVSTDRPEAVAEAMALLAALGHRQLALAGVTTRALYGRQRIAGMKEGCRRLGWNFSRDIHLLEGSDEEDDFAVGEILARKFLAQARRATAILAVNDRVAAGMLRILREGGLRVPRDVSLIGYDNADFSPYTHPPLTTIDPQVEELIARAAGLLDARRAGEPAEAAWVRPRLVLRATHGPAPRRSSQR